jgi:hypothetical protein
MTTKWPAAVTIVMAAALCGCGSSKTAATGPACRPAHAPEYPTTDASLTDDGAGGTWCLPVGETLTVTLHVPVARSAAPWAPITPSDTTVLDPVSNGVASFPRGVTATFLAAQKPGVVTISSTRPDGATWKATVVVRAG